MLLNNAGLDQADRGLPAAFNLSGVQRGIKVGISIFDAVVLIDATIASP